jgi:predicted ATPase
VGIGGTGKTRLALRLAMRQRGAFADGAVWVDLAQLADAQQLPHTLAQALGCKLEVGADAQAELAERLCESAMLLVLDNCEHLLDAVAMLADALLAAAPTLKLLATSREPLGLPDEAVLAVRPLELPAERARPEDAAESEAVQLFMQRARVAAPLLGTEAMREAMPVIVRICRRVDGIPLALELAAAQLKVVMPAQLLQLLEAHFGALVGPRHALARQQTLHAVIQWSYDRLRTEEQQLLGALAVCHGGCDLQAAAALVGEPGQQGTTGEALLSALARLADLSLLAVRPHRVAARYELLETVRHFALEKLHAAGHAAIVRERHAQHYLALAEAHDEEVMREGTGAASLARLDPEHDNLMQAIAWFERDDEPATLEGALRLVAALRHYWSARGLLRPGLMLTQAAVRRATSSAGAAAAPTPALMWALVALAQLHRFAGDAEAALPWARRHLEVASALGDAEGQCLGHGVLGSLLRMLGRFAEAEAELGESLRLARSAGRPRRVADALHGLAILEVNRGRAGAALARMEEVLTLCGQDKHHFKLALALVNTAWFAIANDKPARARLLVHETMALLPSMGALHMDLEALGVGAASMAAGDRLVDAVPLYAAAVRHCSAIGLTEDAQCRELRVAHLHEARRRLGNEAFEAAWTAGSALTVEEALKRLRDGLQSADGEARGQAGGAG